MSLPAISSKPRVLFVSRHVGAQEWARRQGLEAQMVPHLDVEATQPGDVVIGTLPAHLVVDLGRRGVSYRHLAMELPEELRGRDVAADTMELCGARLESIIAYRPAPPALEDDTEDSRWLESLRKKIRHHSSALYGTLILAGSAAAGTWLAKAAGAVMDSLYPSKTAAGTGFWEGFWSRFSMISQPKTDAALGALAFDATVASLAALFMAYLVWRFGRGVLRTQITEWRARPKHARRAVLMALSSLKPESLVQLPLAMQMSLATFCSGEGPRIAWQQNARAVRHHLVPKKKLIVYVVCSSDAALQFEDFRSLMTSLAASVGAEVDVRSASDKPIDVDNYEAVEACYARILKFLHDDEGIAYKDMCIDATSATKVTSIAAAVVTMNRDIEFSYVSNSGETWLFDARLPIAGKTQS